MKLSTQTIDTNCNLLGKQCKEIIPLIFNTAGGPIIDKNARVLTPDGTSIPSLYAAGNNTTGFYDSYPPTGTGLQISSIFGQVAAEQVK